MSAPARVITSGQILFILGALVVWVVLSLLNAYTRYKIAQWERRKLNR